ncbi:MAG: hypothetical protein ACP6IQ_00105 [Candidatus Njordarchaeia archaeon]|nr:hypothetical protein [Candidatus Korarchaeota archaeon]
MSDNPGVKIRVKKGDLELEVTIDKSVSKEQLREIQKLLMPLNLGLGLIPGSPNKSEKKQQKRRSIYKELKEVISTVFKYGQWFTSLDVIEAYEEVKGKSLRQSTCSTYLRRMEEEGYLESRRSRKLIEYRITEEVLGSSVKPSIASDEKY